MIRSDLRGEGAYSTLAERRSDTRGTEKPREDVWLRFADVVGGFKECIGDGEFSRRLLTIDKA